MTDVDLQQFVGTCFICKRRHDNLATSPHQRAPLKWMCKSCLFGEPDGVGRINLQKAYHMPRKALDDYERRALEDGGNAGGSYLDEIGKTDLAELSEDEYATYLSTVLVSYADAMREIVSREIPY